RLQRSPFERGKNGAIVFAIERQEYPILNRKMSILDSDEWPEGIGGNVRTEDKGMAVAGGFSEDGDTGDALIPTDACDDIALLQRGSPLASELIQAERIGGKEVALHVKRVDLVFVFNESDAIAHNPVGNEVVVALNFAEDLKDFAGFLIEGFHRR